MPSRRAVLLASLLGLQTLPLRAQAPMQTPEGFLKSIYEPYLGNGFKGQPYWQVDRYFAPELARAMEADMREAKRRGEVPALDGDPFIDAQDWEVANLVINVRTEGDDQKATGEVAFDNLGKRIQITLDLLRIGTGWRIADIRSPSGLLSDLYKKR